MLGFFFFGSIETVVIFQEVVEAAVAENEAAQTQPRVVVEEEQRQDANWKSTAWKHSVVFDALTSRPRYL